VTGARRALGALLLLPALLAGCSSDEPEEDAAPTPASSDLDQLDTDFGACAEQPDEPAADSDLPGTVFDCFGGGSLDLSRAPGVPTVVNLWASWCPPCRDELPIMERARRELGEQLEIVAIDVREDEATAAAFAEDLVLQMPVGLDTDGRARDAWSAFAMPVHYWLDADGVIRHSAFGGIGPDIMLQGIRSVVPDADWEP
jgi:cytochrome c biogenesis protein CcmG/thiol:disulfide interchange protein DsbE